MATHSTGVGVSLADVYALLLEDIRRNRAARGAGRGADLGAAVSYSVALADDDTRADDTQQQGSDNGAA